MTTTVRPEEFDAAYYRAQGGDVPYSRQEKHWAAVFGNIAATIAETLAPARVFDAGCAMGFLVEQLRRRNIAAFGRDISAYAIGQVPDDLKPFCEQGSVTEPVAGAYDLVTCLGVFEHLTEDEAARAAASLCAAAPLVLFASAPAGAAGRGRNDGKPDGGERNGGAQPPLHWLRLFAAQGFGPRADYDPGFVGPWAMLLERRDRAPDEAELRACAQLIAMRMERAELERERGALAQAHASLQKDADRLRQENEAAGKAREELELELGEARLEADRVTQLLWRLDDAERRLHAFENSTIWRASAPLRAVASRVPALRRVFRRAAPPPPAVDIYQQWVERYDTLTQRDLEDMREKAGQFALRPLISIVMPTYNTPEALLREAVESVQDQTYENWELCIADDASPEPQVRATLEDLARNDPRIRVVFREQNGHISASSNSALELATGQWVALLDHDDRLPPHALYCVVDAINRNPDAGLIYSDEDKIDLEGKRSNPYFKSDWNPALFLGQNMFSHFGVVRTDLMRAVGGFRTGYEGSQDYDLILRCSELITPEQIIHIPQVLYHWRIIPGSTAQASEEKPYAAVAALRALQDHYTRCNLPLEAVSATFFGGNRPLPVLKTHPSVAILIPTRDALDVLRPCIESLQALTKYPNYSIHVIDNRSSDPKTLAYLEEKKRTGVSVIPYDAEFNYAAMHNYAVDRVEADYILFLNNDTEIITPDWLGEMVGLAECLPDTGVVGAKLLYPDRTVQHAGVIVGLRGVAGHYCPPPTDVFGYFGRAALVQNFSAVTFACALVRRALYQQVGGLDGKHLAIAFNDVDFCLKVREAGYRNVWTPNAVLLHFESKTRGQEDTPAKQARFESEVSTMRRRWGPKLDADPFYSPNLSLRDGFHFAFPPRARKPWLEGRTN